MQLTLEKPDFEFFLRAADGRSALVNDRALRASFIVAPDALIEAWPVRDAAAMVPADLDPLLALAPELVLLGTGANQAFPPPAVMAACLSRGIGLESMTNAAAARTYQVLAGEGRRVVAGFVLAPAPGAPRRDPS
ncbi:Mth938-like domain-containing protein [Luteimonas sp. RD2P54]|uniref:Mth938-like domain-containing protein n=1 Tax=Luteimonas endophytica TaxID=3042023 RepID=A0ABT6JC68_9GAMM|nr:Mth938-like domain-containing protein [Luteimonas endophytica]MDH5824391.1 Mth938-like domain-containing protein [Luteimonas endophytica]